MIEINLNTSKEGKLKINDLKNERLIINFLKIYN